VDYTSLMVYLLLILGTGGMYKMGLEKCIPKRKRNIDGKITKSQSLCSAWNRNLDNWDLTHIELDSKSKKLMIAALVQIMILLMT